MRSTRRITLAVALCLTHAGCDRFGLTFGGKDGVSSSTEVGLGSFEELPPLTALEGNHILYMRDQRIYRLEVGEGATALDVSAELDELYPGEDSLAAASRNGEWMTMASTRLACGGDACLTLFRRDMSYVRRVLVNDGPLNLEGRAAVNQNASFIVYAAQMDGAPHEVDLFATARVGDEWSTPNLLTGDSPYEFNTQPVFDPTGSRILFDCGPTEASQAGTSICEVDINGVDFQVAINVIASPMGLGGDHALHHADYVGENSLVFEATWAGSEHIWRKRNDGIPEPISLEYSNDNTPCGFPDGSVGSLWLNRPGGSGVHELKVMDSTGGGLNVLTPEEDLADVGMSCIGAM